MTTVPLYRLAHSRTGDKGNTSNISLVAWDAECYDIIREAVTADVVAQWFALREPGRVTRYELDGLESLNFVIEQVLDGGVNDALNLDAHGKSLSFFLLDLPVSVPDGMEEGLPDIPAPPGQSLSA